MRKLIIILTLFSLLSCNRKEEIPKELNYSFEYLSENWSPEDIEIFKNMKENDSLAMNLHFGIGLHLRNNLLRNHSKSDSIVAYFNSIGITHYDYMSGLILNSYHEHLNNEKITINEKVDEIIENEKPYKECEKKQRLDGLKTYNKFQLNDTINVKMPVSGYNSVVDYSCLNLNWEFRHSFDLSIDGIITDKFYTSDSLYTVFLVKILTKNHPDTKILYNEVNIGDEFEISVQDTAWKIKTTGNNVYN